MSSSRKRFPPFFLSALWGIVASSPIGGSCPRWAIPSLVWTLLTLWVARSYVEAVEAESKVPKEAPITEQDRAHWAYRKPIRPPVPVVRDRGWVGNSVDAFILASLEKAGLKPAPQADRESLLRRITFDLTGLPPTAADQDAFLADKGPDAFTRVVDRLLASPQYGERWAQHWLDVVRYAESNGYELDADRPHAWRYRDYVVRTFNEDKPYNRFITEQLAGDELAQAQGLRERHELLVATGLNRCGPIHLVAGNTDPEVNRQEVLTEMTTTVGAAFLGLTVACARCHDHKFDPISQADYYRLQAFFAGARPRDIDIASKEEKAEYDQKTKELNARLAPLRKQVADLEKPYKDLLVQLKRALLEPKFRDALDVEPKKRAPEQKKLAAQAQILLKVSWDEILDALSSEERARRAQWREQINSLEAQMPPPPARAWAISNEETVPPTHVLKRGNPKQKGPIVTPAFPRILAGEPANMSGRIALARWLTSPDHPLTARVMVNRLWQHHFGRGLVATPNDFGSRGAVPSHPELLDWLTCEFVAHGWSLKHLHRLMVLSNTYQQTSMIQPDAQAKKVDPENRLLWRMNRRRLEGESLRDCVLAAAGTLNLKVGGPMVRVPLEPEVYDLIFTEGEPDGLWHVTPDPREHTRRSIYLFAKRNLPVPLLEAFDRPDMLTSCPVRPVSTFAPQAFILLNGPFFQTQSKTFATRLLRESGPDVDRQIGLAYRLSLGRRPQPKEAAMACDFLKDQAELLTDRLRARLPVSMPEDVPKGIDPAHAAALADFCLAMLNRNEFLYVK